MSKRRTRKELLPPPGFTGTVGIELDGLSFIASSENGKEHTLISAAKYPGTQRLRQDLLVSLSILNGPRGRWRSVETVRSGLSTVGLFLRWLESEGEKPLSAADLDGPLWKRWVLHLGGASTVYGASQARVMRVILLSTPGVSDSLLLALARRTGKPSPTLQTSYSREQFTQILRDSRRVVHRAFRRVSANNDTLQRFRAGTAQDAADECRGRALDELARLGMEISYATCHDLGAYRESRPRHRLAQQELFLDPHEAWACAVLLTAEAGWNLSVIERLVLPDNSVGAGEDSEVLTVRLDKPRRGANRHSTTTVIVESEADTGRALRWIMDATDPARDVLAAVGEPTDQLLVYGRWKGYTASSRFALGVPKGTVRAASNWASFSPISLQKLRRTKQVLLDRTPTQNTRRTHEDSYVLKDAAVHDETRPTIEAGLTNALNSATNYVALELIAEDAADDRIKSGEADTVFCACKDFEHNPRTGSVCKESFLACLGCSNSIATPRHITRLTVLHSGLEELRSTLPEHEWTARWETPHTRLTSLLATHCTGAELSSALATSTDHDRDMISRLLNGEFSA